MRFRSLPVASSLHSLGARRSLCAGAPVAPSLSRRFALSAVLTTTLCAGALLVAPIGTASVWAAPTVGSDEGGPQVQILAPAYQDTLKGRFRISVGVKARKFNPQSIELFVDDRSATKGPVPLAAFPSASFDWNTRDFSDGPHKLTVRVTDTQGFRGWAEVNVYINNGSKVDTLPPTLVWKNVAPYQTLSGQAQIELDAMDNFGVKWLIISINQAAGTGDKTKKPISKQWALNRPPYVANFDTTTVPDGLYTASAKAWDSREQQGDARPLTLGVVNNAINATQIEGLLNGLRSDDPTPAPQVAEAPRVPVEAAPEVKTTLPEPDKIAGYGISGDAAPTLTPKSNDVRAGRSTAPAATPSLSTKPQQRRVASRTNATKPKTSVSIPARTSQARQGVRSTGVPVREVAPQDAPALQPSTPLAVARALVKPERSNPVVDEAKTPRIAVATPLETVALPELSSTNENLGARSGPVEIESESPTESLRPRIARLDATEAVRSVETEAVETETEANEAPAPVASGVLSRVDAPELAAIAPLESAEPTRIAALEPRLSVPSLDAPRMTVARVDETSNDASETSTLNADGAPEARLSTPAPMELEASTSPAAKIVAPEVRVQVAKAPAPVVETVPAPVDEAERVAEVSGSNRAVDLVGPQLSAPAPSPTLKRSHGKLGELATRMTTGARNVLKRVTSVKMPLSAKRVSVAQPKAPRIAPRLAALPRNTREDGITSDVPSITVAPLEISSPIRTPRVHRAWRATTLRAIAARYNFPVELVAAANNWPTEMRVVKGMTVQLPRPLQVSMGGEPLIGTNAMLAGDTSVAAFRFLFEQAGGTLRWDASTKRVIARKGDSEIVLSVGSKVARVDNKDVMMELAAFLFEGRTMIPLRFWEEGLKAQVEWDPQTGRIVVAMTG